MKIRPDREMRLSPEVRPLNRWVLLVAGGALFFGGCQAERLPPSQQQMALGDPTDATVKDSLLRRPTCGKLPPVGCCEGEALWWCNDGYLKGINCMGRPHCGWSNSGFFDCNTSGQADPAGNYSRDCPRDSSGNSTLPALDGGGDDGASDDCKGIVMEGCCSGNLLHYCLGGELRLLDCTLNLACGWKANGGLYDCGTEGGVDPSGKFPLTCPDSPDARADLLMDHGLADQRGDTAGDTGSPPGCSCNLSASAQAQGTIFTCAVLFFWGWWRRGGYRG